jgi:protein-L-isoaspartate O-methyltransferase
MHLPWRDISPIPGNRGIFTSLLDEEAEELRTQATGKNVMEVGVAYGFSTSVLASTAAHVTSVDLFPPICSYPQWDNNVIEQGIRDKVTVVEGDSTVMLPQLTDKFDFIFIDGEHAFDGVTADARNSLPLLKPGGTIMFHDYHEYCCCPDVKPALDALFPEGLRTVGSSVLYTVK